MRSSYLRAALAALVTCALVLAGAGGALAAPSAPCGCEPVFTIEKLQQIEGSGSGFTTAPLTGAIGETVDYEIVVANTGLFPETFSEFSDLHCDEGTLAGGPGADPLSAGESSTYTCRHVLSESGTYTNEATVTATSIWGMPLTQTSNQVVVEVPPATPQFTVEKLQQVAGTIGTFTTAKLSASAGQTLNYQIVVKNTGSAPLTVTSFVDEHCDAGTLKGGPGSAPLASGKSTTYSCTRRLPSPGIYTNVASVTANNGAGSSLTVASNHVEAAVPESHEAVHTTTTTTSTPPVVPPPVVPKKAVQCSIEVSPHALRGASGPKRTPFSVSFSSRAISRIAFYLDGRKIRLLTSSQARHGWFAITIDPRKLAYGVHRVAVKTRMVERGCPALAASSRFTDPKPLPPPPG